MGNVKSGPHPLLQSESREVHQIKPLCVDLFCGLGGWAEGFLAEGYDVIGFDIERRPYPGQLVLQDVLTLHGRQFRNATVIVASPPCQAYSYRAMPWKRAKALPPPSNELFDACFRIQREASEAATLAYGCADCGIYHPATLLDGCGFKPRYIPLVVENVKGAQPWVGRARWHYGSFYLWGDVPALMPHTFGHRKGKEPLNGAAPKGTGSTSWFFGARADPRDMRRNKDGEYTRFGQKNGGGSWFNIGSPGQKELNRNPVHDGQKNGGDWFGPGEDCSISRRCSSRSDARKQASAEIAKIPFDLANHIARVYRPDAATPDSVCNGVEPLDVGEAIQK